MLILVLSGSGGLGASCSAAGAITLEQLAALNDELRALVRAGVPLEKPLRQLAADMSGRLGEAAARLASQLEQGRSLEEALAAEPDCFPPLYRAVVAAGIKAGRLSAALESLSGTALRIMELRRMLVTALVYPLMVFLVAWALFVFFVVEVAPVVGGGLPDVTRTSLWLRLIWGLAGWRDTVWYWGPAVPVGVLTTALVWALYSARAAALEPRMTALVLGWLPWTRRMLADFRTASLAELLALMVENDVPLPAGLRLAAEAVGNPRMMAEAHSLADAIERGQWPTGRPAVQLGTPLLAWMLSFGHQRGLLGQTLRRASAVYHARARDAADAARLMVPLVLAVGIGGTVTAGYALLVLGSWAALLRALGRF